MSNKPSGLRPPTKVFTTTTPTASTRPSGLPLSNSNVPNTTPPSNPSAGQQQQGVVSGASSLQPSPSGSVQSLASLRSKDYSSTRVDSSSLFTRRRLGDFGWNYKYNSSSEEYVDHSLDPDGPALNDDTDSFIIGETVWVGGEKRGRIAFLGETQFGKGEWGGVVLDEPVGKNDGSVQGVRYFYCEKNHGVFVHLTRLTRQPLTPYKGEMSRYESMTPRQNTPPRILKSPSPGERSSSRLGSPGQLKIDERVIVQSSTGTKKGILRYLGPTDFANGEWAGVELDTPNGKNDGSVGDRRYFHCRPQYGLFAPIHKVTSSPANRHSTSGLRRHGSKESMASNLSSAASSRVYQYRSSRKSSTSDPSRSHGTPCLPSCSLQNVLKEKEKHLEHLLQEKDLDRQELAQAMLKLEESKTELITMQAEHSKTQGDTYMMSAAIQSELDTIKKENESLKNNLEEFQRKYDDLLFTTEEDKISRAELQSQFEACQQELFLAKEDQINATAATATDDAKMMTEDIQAKLESLTKLKESLNQELESLKQELQRKNMDISNLQSSLHKMESECVTKSSMTTSAENEIKTLAQTLETANAKINTLESELVNAKVTVVSLEGNLAQLDNSKTSFSEQLIQSNLAYGKLAKELEEKNKVITTLRKEEEEKRKTLEKLKVEDENRHKLELNEMKKLVGEYRNKSNFLEAALETLSKLKEQLCQEVELYMNEMGRVRDNLKASEERVKTVENLHQVELDEVKKAMSEYKSKCSSLQASLESTSVTKEQLQQEVNSYKNETEKLIKSLQKSEEKVTMVESMLQQAKIESQGTTSQIEAKTKEIIEQLNNEVASRNKRIESLGEEINLLKDECQKTISIIKEKEIEEGKKDVAIVQAQEKVQELSATVANMQISDRNYIETTSVEITKLQSELNTKAAEEIRLKEQIRQQNDDLTTTQIELQCMVDDRDKRIVELDSLIQSLTKKMESSYAEFKENSQKLTLEVESKNAEIERLSSQLVTENQNCMHFKMIVDSFCVDSVVQESSIDMLTSKLESCQAELKENSQKFASQNELKNTEIEKLSELLKAANEKCMQYENSYEQSTLDSADKEQKNVQIIKQLQDLISKKDQDIEKLMLMQKEANIAKVEFENSCKETEAMKKDLESLTALGKSLTKELDTMKSRENNMTEAHKAEISRWTLTQSETTNALHKFESSQKQSEEIIAGLNRELASLRSSKEISDKSDPGASATNEAHVNFLNSIIVDLQKEKQQLHDKLNILLSGGNLPDANSNVKMEDKSRNLRMYCDICEEFDVHETEDCPKQASDPDQNSKHGVVRGSERPYCDACEVFGHWTSDCDDCETF